MTDQPTGPRCGNNPNFRMSDGDRKAVDDFKARLALRASAKPYIDRAVWVDGDPLMEVIAVTVWERCARDDKDMPQLVCDDPRTIAAFAAAVARAHADAAPAAVPVVSPPATDRATLRSDLYDDLDQFARETGIPGLQHAQIRDRLAEFLAEGLLRRMADEVQQQGPWATDGARIGRVLIWSWARVGDTDFGQGYRTAQEDVRAILTRPLLGAEGQPETEPGADLIEDYLRFLRGQGPEPDLSDLSQQQRAAIVGQFEIVRALADRDPNLPPLDRDPVARRLGLHPTADEAQQQPATETRDAWGARPRCTCPHAADEHSVYGCLDGCACEWMPKRQSVQHTPGTAVLCPGCRAKGYSVCMADEEARP